MQIRNTQQSYGLVAILMHWLMAIIILGLFALGLWMTDLTYYDQWYRTAPNIHKSVGILLAFALLFRVFWRITNVKPPLPKSVPRFEAVISGLVHLALYGLMFMIVISGYFISTADGRAIEVFNWFSIPAITTPIENQEDIAGDLHFYLALTLIAIVNLHALAALKHHFIDKDNILKRMINPNP